MDSAVVAAEDQVFSDIGGEVAILDLKGGTYYGLDAVGVRIWNLVQRPRKIVEVRDELLAEYEVDAKRCERDLLDFISALESEGLVEVTHP
ncbi:PqqD family peptide modification chaperone [Rubrobacter tropicus]|nr:PqqD family peptide modification chaperone [Rubrobacter tropicus]